ncbi:DUF4890 domain-containing protein [Belliella kenyensis]|uniref:DUF4890 domain-containing protein n=1 Tax=Belliella kenyensis TaxID=1472724 RepID=A0ABV8EKX7_9BACT|nr:DUF4890 domain-containing protein [Belliella kenyensis]MCH7401441.1 DUF4890 domain-containing protein [Belliella kenyensis]MDN3602884.1 DUF4890 domain-containing protein [Belliella kenyensis]
MKKLLIIVAMFSLGVLSAQAQRVSPRNGMSPEKRAEMASPEKRAEMATNRLADKLELDENQKGQIYTIHLENANKKQAEMEARKEEMKAKREEMKAKHQAQQEKITAVLTPEQLKRYEQLQDEDKKRMNTIRDARTNPDREKYRRGQRGERGARGPRAQQ